MEWIPRYYFINYLIEKYDYKTYLEIGVNHGECIDKININVKDGVDPVKNSRLVNYVMTSDDFFAGPGKDKKYDIIFIDGLHLYEQVIKDIDNSLNTLNKNGIILLHDCCPMEQIWQVREHVIGRPWNGDVWKSILHFRKTRKDLFMCTIDSDYGIGLIARGEQDIFKDDLNYEDVGKYTYEFLDKNRKELLNLVSVAEFQSMF